MLTICYYRHAADALALGDIPAFSNTEYPFNPILAEEECDETDSFEDELDNGIYDPNGSHTGFVPTGLPLHTFSGISANGIFLPGVGQEIDISENTLPSEPAPLSAESSSMPSSSVSPTYPTGTYANFYSQQTISQLPGDSFMEYSGTYALPPGQALTAEVTLPPVGVATLIHNSAPSAPSNNTGNNSLT